MREDDLYRELMATEDRVRRVDAREPRPVTDYAHLVRSETWQQAWNPDTRVVGPVRTVSGAVWSDAMECCLRENGSAHIPKTAAPIYIDRPIVLPSGNRLKSNFLSGSDDFVTAKAAAL